MQNTFNELYSGVCFLNSPLQVESIVVFFFKILVPIYRPWLNCQRVIVDILDKHVI